MATKLKAKDPKEAKPSKPKILIYGKPGVGKTWQALDFPKCYYIDTEGGANLNHYTAKLRNSGGVYMGPEDGSLDFQTVLDQFKALATEKHEYKTLIVDSLSQIFNALASKESEKLYNEKGHTNTYGAEKKLSVFFTRRLADWANRLDMNVIFICHSKGEWLSNGKGDKEEVGQTFDAWDKLEYQLHLCLEIFKQGQSRKARVRKSRLIGFPEAEVFEWSYINFAERYGKDIIEANVEAINLATSEQVSELKRLVELIKTPQETIDKWLTKAMAETFEEMTESQINACIKYQTEQFNKGNK